MLLDQGTIDKINLSIDGLMNSYAEFLVSRSLNTGVKRFVMEALQLSSLVDLSPMELAYVTGMLVREMGPDEVMLLSAKEIVSWVNNHEVYLNSLDRVTLDQMKNDTLTFMSGLGDSWKRKINAEVVVANQAWRGLMLRGKYADPEKRTKARKRELRLLVGGLRKVFEGFIYEIDRLVQTELSQYVQHASVAGLHAKTKIYKIPHEDACDRCRKLHLDHEGVPRIFFLEDVVGNSNINNPRYDWEVCVGPTHPFCSCILYREDQVPITARI